jgi:UDPglucose 6-dehydrogenase
MKICVIGTGYVGLVTGVCLSDMGNTVICIDNDSKKIEKLNKDVMPIYEPGLEDLVLKNKNEGRLSFSTSIADGVKKSDIIFISVNTPPKPSGEADLSSVAKVCHEIAICMDSYKIIVDKSTVPVETGEKVAETIRRYNKHNIEFDVVSNPEFLREGTAIYDTMNPDRIVIGTNSVRAAKVLQELYAPLKAHTIITDIKSAEIIKHASNSFLAMKISYMNALSVICEKAGADVEKVAEGMGFDKRIGRAFLNAGIGYGGACFPKDVSAFIHIAEKINYDFKLLKAVEEINAQQRKNFVKKVEDALWVVSGKTIAVLGLAFKPNTDDMRGAPSIDIIIGLQKEGAKIKAYDPQAIENAKTIFDNVTYCSNIYETCEGADCVLLLTEWEEFKCMDLEKIRNLLTHPVMIDGRNMFDPIEMESKGFVYKSVGR